MRTYIIKTEQPYGASYSENTSPAVYEGDSTVATVDFVATDWENTGHGERCTGCGHYATEKMSRRTITGFSGDERLEGLLEGQMIATAYGCCSPLKPPHAGNFCWNFKHL